MLLYRHLPAAPLNNYVDSILHLTGNNRGTGLPKTAMSLVFNLGDGFRLFADDRFSSFTEHKRYWVAGLQTAPSRVESFGQSEMVVVQFKPVGAYAFLQQPLFRFSEQYIPLDAVWNRWAEDTWQRLKEAVTVTAKMEATERFLLQRLRSERTFNPVKLQTVTRLAERCRNGRIADVCREERLSRKHLAHLFAEQVGLPPKMWSSVCRLQTILQTISRHRPERLTSFAYDADYADQAHFNNDFKRFTGLKPTEYLRLAAAYPGLQKVPHFLPPA